MDAIEVSRPTHVMTAGITQPLVFDISPPLLDGETPSTPVVTLLDVASQQDYTIGLVGVPTIAFDDTLGVWVFTQSVGNLVAGHVYQLKGIFTAVTGKQWPFLLTIRCVA